LFPVLVALLAAFVLLFVFRVGGARRRLLLDRWPALLLAGAALFALARAQIWPALALALLAGVAWKLWPALNSRSQNQQRAAAAADIEACAALGVTLDAGEQEVRRAYREKMARAHPDRGGGHAEAARLTAARDRLLRRLRG
jgi:hypothetical protein